MDECNAPGFLWPYGNTKLKTQLAFLTWNTNCKNLLTQMLAEERPPQERRNVIKKLVFARNFIDQQSEAVFKLTMGS